MDRVINSTQETVTENKHHSRDLSFSSNGRVVDYGKIKVGTKTLDDAVIDLGIFKHPLKRPYGDKNFIIKSIANKDLENLRAISDFFFGISGIYEKICKYFATMYRYDWYVVPEIYDNKANVETVKKDFYKILGYLDNSHIKKLCGDIALKVIKEGCYYGYLAEGKDGMSLQELPIKYCRSRYSINGNPAIEFDMSFFDNYFGDVNYRMRVLKMFPPEFAKGYVLYKQGKLQRDFQTDPKGTWYLLDPKNTVKFSFDNGDVPLFINSIPSIIDLDAAQDLDRRKQMQKLLKIIVQKLPIDKNGDLIFYIDEAKDLHNNAVEMLRKAVGVDVLTTFADVDSIDTSDNTTASSADDLQKVERTVFNSFGVSRNLFNTDGNLSLEKSILTDEGAMSTLLYQFEEFFDRITQQKSPSRAKYNFKFYMLETTRYNYQDLSKMYKEQVQLGYSKMLPQIALGHSQSAILNTAHFENDILKLTEVMIPPLMSSTMSLADLKDNNQQSDSNSSQNKTGTGTTQAKDPFKESEAGRPEKKDSEKSEKTIQNKESMG